MKHWILWSFLALTTIPAWAAEPEVDILGVAAVLLRDGNLEKAAKVLSEVEPGSSGIDQSRFHTLSGVLALRQGRFAEAESSLVAAQGAGQRDPAVVAYLAQARYSQQKWTATVETLEGFARMNSFPDLYGMLGQAQWNLGQISEAFDTLDRALRTFPDRRSFHLQRMGYLLSLGLNQSAAQGGNELIDRSGNDPAVPLAVGESLRRAGQATAAISILETARLRFPSETKLTLALGQAYADQGLALTAARLVEGVAVREPRFLADAAELYRRSGDYRRALFLNGQLEDTTTKARQRFSILIDAQRFEEAMALKGRLERLGLLVEDRWRYAAAYAAYRIQDLGEAQTLLAGITESTWFGRAVQLRRAIEVAKSDPHPLF